MAGEDRKPPPPDRDATILISASGIAPTGFGAPRDAAGGQYTLNVGDVLNNMFEVKRFIARGGMGEVFEGINIASDERVAIKVMLPGHAEDSKLLALFRKEARTLTRLNHPALVQYRVLAQEPRLGVFYIVTEFVEGANLSDVIGRLDPTPQELLGFVRRLGRGLEAAHTLGAIHRDLSPDNVMLEGGLLSGARIIDFGIAKELNSGVATIIGDSFAGKLNYVAPEQLGDFDRSIGPWTDIYSLGLVLLAVATHRHADMGGTLVSAVDKRRAGPDLSETPEELRPLLSRMLKPDPAERLRSMHEVLELANAIEAGRFAETPPSVSAPSVSAPSVSAAPAPEAPAPEASASETLASAALSTNAAPPDDVITGPETLAIPGDTPEPPAPEAEPAEPVRQEAAPMDEPAPAWDAAISGDAHAAHLAPAAPALSSTAVPSANKPSSGGKPLPILLAVGAVLALLIAGSLWFFVFGGKDRATTSPSVAAQGDTMDAAGDPARITAELTAGLPSVTCAWLDLVDVKRTDGGTTATLRGVSGDAPGMRRQIDQLLAGRNLKVAALDTAQVAPVVASECALLDAFRQIRDPAGGTLSMQQRQVEMTDKTSGPFAGSVAATANAEFNLADPARDLALISMESSGKVSQLTSGRAELIAASDALDNGRYRLPLDIDHTGWAGLVTLTGNQPFDRKLLAGAPGSWTADWSRKFLAAAKERNWKTEMVWFQIVDDQPNQPASASAE